MLIPNSGPRRGHLLRLLSHRRPPSRSPLDVPALRPRHREASPRRPPDRPPQVLGEVRDRRQVEGVQLGQEACADGAEEEPYRLRPLQGHAPEEAATIRGAQGSCQDQGFCLSETTMVGTELGSQRGE